MKKNIRIKNIFFIICIILFLLIIFLINYKTDAYGFFKKTKDSIQICDIGGNNMTNIYIKGYKNRKRDTVIIGGSDACGMFGNGALTVFHNGIYLNAGCVTFKNRYEILKLYLNLHPETKNVVLVTNYQYIFDNNYDCEVSKTHKFTLNDIFYLFYSYDITTKNLKIIKNKILNITNPEDELLRAYYHVQNFYSPYRLPIFKYRKDIVASRIEDYKYIEKLNNLFKEKNINCYVIIPPYSSLFLYTLYTDVRLKDQVIDLKRKLVENFGIVYDAAFINEYTDINLKNGNYLYSYCDHPNWIFGIKLYKILFDKTNADEDIIMYLTKDNFDECIRKQQDIFDGFYLKKGKTYKDFLNIIKKLYENNNVYDKWNRWMFDEIPQDLKSELKYAEKKRQKYIYEKY